MSENKFCKECGAPLGEEAVFCTGCGAKVTNNTDSQATENVEQGTQTSPEQNFSQVVNDQVTQQYNQTSENQQPENQQPENQQPMNQQPVNPDMEQQSYTVPQYSPYPTQEQQQKNDKSGKLIARIIGVVAVAAAIFLVYKIFFSYPAKPEDVAENFVEALMVDMDANETAKYVIEEHKDISEIKDVISEFKEQGIKISNVQSKNADVDGDTAEVNVKVKISLGGETTTNEVTLELTKISGKWKVSDFN